MRAITKMFIIFILSGSFSGCIYSTCEKIDLKNEDLSKLSFYEGIKFLVFKSNLGGIDTLTLQTNNISYTPCNKFELSDYQYQIKHVSFTNSTKHGDTYSDITFELNNEFREDSSAIFYLRVNNVWSEYDEHVGIDTISNDFMKKKFICKEYSWDGSTGSGKDYEIRNFYWDDSNGLIRYITQGGEIYDLIKYY